VCCALGEASAVQSRLPFLAASTSTPPLRVGSCTQHNRPLDALSVPALRCTALPALSRLQNPVAEPLYRLPATARTRQHARRTALHHPTSLPLHHLPASIPACPLDVGGAIPLRRPRARQPPSAQLHHPLTSTAHGLSALHQILPHAHPGPESWSKQRAAPRRGSSRSKSCLFALERSIQRIALCLWTSSCIPQA
jgi:hypothetical protein